MFEHICPMCGLQFIGTWTPERCPGCRMPAVVIAVAASDTPEIEVKSVTVNGRLMYEGDEWPDSIEVKE